MKTNDTFLVCPRRFQLKGFVQLDGQLWMRWCPDSTLLFLWAIFTYRHNNQHLVEYRQLVVRILRSKPLKKLHSCDVTIPLSYLSLYDIMTHSHFDTWHHNKISKACQASNMTRDSKSVNLTHFQRLSICNLTSHSHYNLRRVSKSPLLHPFTCHRSGTLDHWHVTKATSADSSRLIHTI
jgi:hypothetical protein